MEKWKSRLILRESVFTAVAFIIATYSYYFISIWGVQDQFNEGPLKNYMGSPYVHVEILGFGLLFGLLIGVINRITDSPALRRKPVGLIIFYRTILYVFGLLIVASLVMSIFVLFIYPLETLKEMTQDMTIRYALTFLVWMILAVGLINFMLEIERIVGPGNIWRIFRGRYRRPRREVRIFLFMDLKGSTMLAEKLGHHLYSALLQECYRDLTKTVLRHEAAIYQYVGDEVVLSWIYSGKNRQKDASINTFFDYQFTLHQKREVYIQRFGEVPEFRGGIDLGPVTTIEVGDVKREIVYHGDVLNTASRLLEICKDRSNRLVISGEIGKNIDHKFRQIWSESIYLRGKHEPVEAVGLDYN